MVRNLMVLATVGPLTSLSAIAQTPRDEFIKDYEPHAIAIRDAYTNATGQLRSAIYTNDGRHYATHHESFRYNFHNFLHESTTHLILENGRERTTAKRVTGQNRRYGFTLSDSGVMGRRALVDLTPTARRTHPLLCQLSFPYGNQVPTGRSYLDLAKRPDVQVLQYGPASWWRPVRELVVEFTTPEEPDREPHTARLALAFAPELQWVCVGCRCYTGSPTKPAWEERYEYGQPVGGWPVPKSREHRVFADAAAGGRRQYLIEVLEFTRSPVPFQDGEFTLAANGFPEPDVLPEVPDDGERPMLGTDMLAPPGRWEAFGVKWPVAAAVFAAGIVVAALLARHSRRATAAGVSTMTRRPRPN